MSKSKTMKVNCAGVSPNMMRLHLRWQQIRSELLQQITLPLSPTDARQETTHKKAFAPI